MGRQEEARLPDFETIQVRRQEGTGFLIQRINASILRTRNWITIRRMKKSRPHSPSGRGSGGGKSFSLSRSHGVF